MNGFSRVLDLLMGNNPRSRGERRSSRSRLPEQRRSSLGIGVRRLQLEPLEVRTLLSACTIALLPAQANPLNTTNIGAFPAAMDFEVKFDVGVAAANAATVASAINLSSSTINTADLPVAGISAVQIGADPKDWDVTVHLSGTHTPYNGVVTASVDGDVITDTNSHFVDASPTPASITVDNTPLNVTIARDASQPATVSTPANPADLKFVFGVTFSKPIDATTFTSADLTAAFTPQSPGAPLSTLSIADLVMGADSQHWTVTVKDAGINVPLQDGLVTLSLPASQVNDTHGNPNTLSTPATGANQVDYNLTPFTVQVVQNTAVTATDPTNGLPGPAISFLAKFNEPVKAGTFTPACVSFAGSTAAGTLVAAIGSYPPLATSMRQRRRGTSPSLSRA